MCPTCDGYHKSFPFARLDIFDGSDSETTELSTSYTAPAAGSECASRRNMYCFDSHLLVKRERNARNVLIADININSLQNKFEELNDIMTSLKAHVEVVSETKIDSSYPDQQFAIDRYQIFRNDRVKGGGGILAYVDSAIPAKRIKLPKTYKTIEAMVIETRIADKDMVLGIYRPPAATGEGYYLKLEEELNSLCTWASMLKNFILVTGDLNLNRLRPDTREGKLLRMYAIWNALYINLQGLQRNRKL